MLSKNILTMKNSRFTVIWYVVVIYFAVLKPYMSNKTDNLYMYIAYLHGRFS